MRFYPQSAQSLEDISTARAASDVADLIEQNNQVEKLLTAIGYFLWTDGKLGAYVRYVADAQRFGSHEETLLAAIEIPLGPDKYVCPGCGKETPALDPVSGDIGSEVTRDPWPVSRENQVANSQQAFNNYSDSSNDDNGTAAPSNAQGNANLIPNAFFTGHGSRVTTAHETANPQVGARQAVPASEAPASEPPTCSGCGAQLAAENIKKAERVTVPRVVGTRRVPNGQEEITIAGGLELNTPVWANEMHEFPYLQWQTEVHRAKLKATYPHAANKIESSPSQGSEDVYARVSRLSVEQGLPSIHPGDALMNLITFDRTWLRPWAFYSVEDETVRGELLALFPDGCYVGFAGDVYCEARNESMDDHWRVLHALPGDGQNRPSVGDSLVQVQERYNVLSNMQAETYEYGIPPIYADPQVLDFDAIANQTAEPAAHFPARARPGQPLSAGFFQPAPARVPPDMIEHQQDLIGPIAQFLTGLFPAVFGGNMEDVKTASGYALARDQALGRLGLVWRRMKQFYADVIFLGVECFRDNRPQDVEIPLLGPDGVLDARVIRTADLKGNICVHPEADETFPRLKSQQRGVLQQLFGLKDPLIQEALTEPANIGYIKNVLGLSELVVPGEDSRNKQLREIQRLLASAPILVEVPMHPHAAATMAPGDLLTPHATSHATPHGTSRATSHASLHATSHASPYASGAHPSHGSVAPAASSSGDGNAAAQTTDGALKGAVTNSATNSAATEHGSRITDHATHMHTLVLPSVPVDQLLDDHAVEFEECKRWANSEAGQAAHMTNPAGFSNVRAHAEAHLRAMSIAAAPPPSNAPPQ